MNYGNPYYMGNAAQQMMTTYPFSYQAPPVQPIQPTGAQMPPQQPQTQPYDFIGKYVNSYEEVKDAPFIENTMIFLDAEHDRVYVKKISEEGVPQINVLGLTDIQTPIQTQVSNEQPVEVSVDKKIENAINDLSKKFEEKINEVKKEVKITKSF